MTIEIKGRRPAVISEELAVTLMNFYSFVVVSEIFMGLN